MLVGYIDNIIPAKRNITVLLKSLLGRNDGTLAETARRHNVLMRRYLIASHGFAEDKIIGSTFASPARYLMEVSRKLSVVSAKADHDKLIVNPVFGIPENAVAETIKYLNGDPDDGTIKIFSDTKGYPIAYFIPNKISAEPRYLSLLSAVDAEIDKELLKYAYLAGVKVIYTSHDLDLMTLYNKFEFNVNYRDIYKWIAGSAAKCLKNIYGMHLEDDSHQTLSALKLAEMRQKRDSIPFTAVMPHHAGDVLFLAMAMKEAKTYLKGMIISNWYKDIMESDFKELQVKTVDLLPMMRDGNKKTDEEIILDIVSSLSEQDIHSSFYYNCRPSRNFWISNYHMIDQFGFAIGAAIDTEIDMLSRRCVPVHRVPRSLSQPYKILLHFEGGWPLKAYPEKDRITLMNMLRSTGCKLTLLSSSYTSIADVHAVKYTNLANYNKLLDENHLLIGMDSFPVHYAAFIKGTPSLCLFGNTIPMVSFCHDSDYYSYLVNTMNCTHCGGVDKCPPTMKTECDNFPAAEKVYAAVVSMLNKLYVT
ncbi:MAG: glycosyltransferase family 9 protein [Nitrospirota bacterium]